MEQPTSSNTKEIPNETPLNEIAPSYANPPQRGQPIPSWPTRAIRLQPTCPIVANPPHHSQTAQEQTIRGRAFVDLENPSPWLRHRDAPAIINLMYLSPKRQSLRGTLGANLGKHWPTWGQLGAHLGLTWGQLGVPLGHTCGHLGPTWANMVQLGANVGQLGPTSVRMRDPTTMQEPAMDQRGRAFVALLGPTWANIGQQGANLGPTWSNLGPTWGQLGAHLGPTCSHLGPTLGLTWANLGQLAIDLGPAWGQLAPTGANLGL